MKKLVALVLVLTCVLSLVGCNANNATEDSDETNKINIVYTGTEEIYEIGYAYYVNGVVVCSGGGCNADGSAIKTGDDFTLEKEAFMEEAQVVVLELFVSDQAGKEYACPSKITLSTDMNTACELHITGDYLNGFDVARDIVYGKCT